MRAQVESASAYLRKARVHRHTRALIYTLSALFCKRCSFTIDHDELSPTNALPAARYGWHPSAASRHARHASTSGDTSSTWPE